MKRIFLCLVALWLAILFTACTAAATPPSDQTEASDSISSKISEKEPSLWERTEPLSPEEASAEIAQLIPKELSFDPAEFPLLESPPTAKEILGDYPEVFVFDESDWTLAEETDIGKRYTNNKGLQLFLVNDGSVNITHEAADATQEEEFYLFYDTSKNIRYFSTYDASYEVQMSYTESESGELIGNGIINSMLRKGNLRYHHECLEDGSPISARIVAEEEQDGWIVTRDYSYNPATDSLNYAHLDLTRADGGPHCFSAGYNEEGRLWANAYYTYNSEFSYVFDENHNFLEKIPYVYE